MAIITLTSDIGTKDYLTGAIKGRLLSVNNAFVIADISHGISAFNYNEAAYLIRNAYKAFPQHSWHLLLINLFDNAHAGIILAFHNGHYFACANNGLLTMVFDGMPEQAIAVPFGENGENNVLQWVDKVAVAIQQVEEGKAFHLLGDETENLLQKNNLKPLAADNYLEGRVIYIDNFENVIVNITREQFDAVCKGRKFRINFIGDESITKLSNSYADVADGGKLAFFNTAGYLEIAVNKGNAAGLFGLQPFNTNLSGSMSQSKIFYQTVKVYFF